MDAEMNLQKNPQKIHLEAHSQCHLGGERKDESLILVETQFKLQATS